MAITCPRCGSEFDVTLFQFGHRVRCHCGAEVEYPGTDLRTGHILVQGEDKSIAHEDRCVGCLLGAACGDILGAAVEGSSAREIHELYGELRDFAEPGRGYGCYTDDTQMTLALATSLVECGLVDAAHVSAKYAEFYEAWRGYGGAAHRVMRLLADGGDYRGTGRLQFPEGSFGNGGAMRIAPVGLAYRHAGADDLAEAVEDAILCTHVHPEAIDGALVQAKAVATAATTEPGSFDPESVAQVLAAVCRTETMRAKLAALADGLQHNDEDVLVIGRVGNSIRASEAVAAALWAFLRYGKTPEESIIRAVGFGGDTDTIGAMVGALVGALHGSSWIPARWHDNIENGTHGRDEIVALARRLAGLDIRSPE
ncbi:MAG: ADP-ribosylglycohydrolase family protein [Thermoguttaceae bacterium]